MRRRKATLFIWTRGLPYRLLLALAFLSPARIYGWVSYGELRRIVYSEDLPFRVKSREGSRRRRNNFLAAQAERVACWPIARISTIREVVMVR